jgi:predicted MFS family arabinose efflux permease
LLAAEAVLALGHAHTWWLVTGLWLFFTGFILLESLLPSLVSRVAPAQTKGAAIGIYTTAQFLGVAIGGPIGGFLYSRTGATGVFVFVAVCLVAWLIAVVTMPRLNLTVKNSEKIQPI